MTPLLFSVWYAVRFNDSHLVAPMDFETYTFQAKHLPMLLSGGLTVVYAVSLFCILLRRLWRSGSASRRA